MLRGLHFCTKTMRNDGLSATSLCDNSLFIHFPGTHRMEQRMDDNRKKALVAALGQIEKQFGKGSVMRLGDAAATYDVESVSTGSLGLDIALGIGGLPRGRVVEVYGP